MRRNRPVHVLTLLTGVVLAGIVLAGILAPTAAAERATLPFADYRTESWFLPQSPGVTGGPAAGLFNPAAFAITDKVGMDAWWFDPRGDNGGENWGFALGRTLGFGLRSRTFGAGADEFDIHDYQLNLATGGRAGSAGVAYRWSRGGTDLVPSESVLALGLISRCCSWLSFGAAGNISLESRAAQYVFDLGIRPLGRDWLTLFADWTANDDQAFFRDGTWGAGLEIRPIRGLHLGGRVREQAATGDLDYTVIVGMTLGDANLTALPLLDKNSELLGTTYLARTTPPFPGADPEALRIDTPGRRYLSLSLENKYLTYQRYRLFDDKRIAWLDLLPLLEAIRDADKLAGIAINVAGLSARTSLLWELRQLLEQIQDSGKEVILHGDRFGMGTYYLASVADQLTLDPTGGMMLPGLALARTYLKGTLEKLGLGFQEFRYFKYKSAVESLSRDSMSEGDREQRQRIVDVLFEELRRGMMDGRELSLAQFDEIVNEKTRLSARECLELGLVDRLARWDELGKWLHEERSAGLSGAEWLDFDRRYYDHQWGPAPKIAVVYAVGACEMDSGIKGRSTSDFLRRLIGNPDVAAVVLRADSPGGDPLPSDLVADAVRKLKAAGKPVIISQGDVAASGGYWISMDGTEILTTPLTITGSIGVIGGWVYDDGLSSKLGMSTDGVQRGEHADLFSSVSLPFLGGLPRRGLDQGELDQVETSIRGMYDEFVAAVATGRGLSEEAVGEVAQGRVWMGGDAIEHGLCDRYGSLADAIALARATAGIEDWREVDLVEYPPRPLIKWPSFGPQMPSLFGLGDVANRWLARLYRLDQETGAGDLDLSDPVGLPGLTAMEMEYVKAIAGNPGRALLMVAPDLLPEGWDRTD